MSDSIIGESGANRVRAEARVAADHRPAFERMAASVERVLDLPAVATLDWGDRAASSLIEIARPVRACLLIATVDPSGTIRSHEAAGVASNIGGPAAEESSSLLELRSRAERLSDLGFRPSTLNGGGMIADLANSLVDGPTWRDTVLQRLWGGLDATDLMIGMSNLGSPSLGRVLIAMVALTAEGEHRPRFQSVEIEMLRALMPRLVERTVLAVGSKRSTATRWLTAREQEVLERLTLGMSVREIAEAIERSPHTVHDHVKSLHRKLNASSRGELVARALGYLDEQHQARGPFAEATAKPSGDAGRAAAAEVAKEVVGETKQPSAEAEAKPLKATPIRASNEQSIG